MDQLGNNCFADEKSGFFERREVKKNLRFEGFQFILLAFVTQLLQIVDSFSHDDSERL